MPGKAWLLPIGVVITCIPCLLIPVTAALIAGGAFGGALGLLGVPWVLAAVLAVPIVAALLAFRLHRRVPTAACELPHVAVDARDESVEAVSGPSKRAEAEKTVKA